MDKEEINEDINISKDEKDELNAQTAENDVEAHDALLCVLTGKLIKDENNKLKDDYC